MTIIAWFLSLKSRQRFLVFVKAVSGSKIHLNADVPLTAGMADGDIFHNTRDLTTAPIAKQSGGKPRLYIPRSEGQGFTAHRVILDLRGDIETVRESVNAGMIFCERNAKTEL